MHQPIVLLIGQNRSQTALIQHHLQEVGYEVVKAEYGNAVPQMLIQVQPQLILLDWNLLDCSALAVIRAVRSQPGFRRLPIILLGREIGCENRILSLEAGVDFCLDGVVYPKEIVARVRALLRRVE